MTDGQRAVMAEDSKCAVVLLGTSRDYVRGGGDTQTQTMKNFPQHKTVPYSPITSYQQ